MKRTKSHEIDTQAQRIFSTRIPVGWVARKQYPDYGIDYEIEIFHKGKSTGDIVQDPAKRDRKIQRNRRLNIDAIQDGYDITLTKFAFPCFS